MLGSEFDIILNSAGNGNIFIRSIISGTNNSVQ